MLTKERGERGALSLSFFICACSRFTPDGFCICVWNQRSTFSQGEGWESVQCAFYLVYMSRSPESATKKMHRKMCVRVCVGCFDLGGELMIKAESVDYPFK